MPVGIGTFSDWTAPCCQRATDTHQTLVFGFVHGPWSLFAVVLQQLRGFDSDPKTPTHQCILSSGNENVNTRGRYHGYK